MHVKQKGMVINMDPDSSMIYNILLLIFLISLCGFFSLSEGAIVSLSDSKIKKLAEEGDKNAKRIVEFLASPSKFLAMIQTGITVCGIFSAALAIQTFIVPLGKILSGYGFSPINSYAVSLIIIVLLNAFFILVFSKLLPRRIGVYNPLKIALAVSLPLKFLSHIMIPVVVLSDGATTVLLSLLGFKPGEEPENVTEEEIRMLVDVGEEKGVIEQSEKDMINNVFEFDDRTVSEVMTHRMNVVGLELSATLEEILETAIDSGYSRMPVYEESMDKIIGILYVKDILKFMHCPQDFVLENVMRKAIGVPIYTSCTELLKEFKIKKVQFAVVADEYGGTYGVVTMEDLLETIVGDIQDEYDNEEEEITQNEDGSFTFSANTAVDDVENALDIELASEDEDLDTIGGLLTHRLGYIPTNTEESLVSISGIMFEVTEMEDSRILKIKATFSREDEEK